MKLPPSHTEGIRVFIVDDHPMIRMSLIDLFAMHPELVVCGDAGSCAEALEKIPAANPDVVVLDLGLGEANGFELLRNLRRRHPGIRSLVFSMHEESKFALRCINEGAQGYVMKKASPEVVLEAVFQASQGKLVVSPEIQQQSLMEAAGGGAKQGAPDRVLSSREWQVFECLGKGMTMREIAEHLRISEKTVGSFCDRIKTKLGKDRLRDVAQMAMDWNCDGSF